MSQATIQVGFELMFPLPEPDSHPLKSNVDENRIVRLLFLTNICVDYAEVLRMLVEKVLERKDPYRGGNGEALLAITAAREVLRVASTITRTCFRDQLFADELERNLGAFENRHLNLKLARDVLTHVDEYIQSTGRIQNQWFDITNRFDGQNWIFRIGNKLDINMPQLAEDVTKLAEAISQIVRCAVGLETLMKPADQVVEDFLERGLSVDVIVEGDTAKISSTREDPGAWVSHLSVEDE